jgi:hypothetical protein
LSVKGIEGFPTKFAQEWANLARSAPHNFASDAQFRREDPIFFSCW